MIAAGLVVAMPAGAQPAPTALTGWWRGTASHAGESKDIYLHFEERDGKPFVRFSIPWIAADNSPLGPYTIEGRPARLPIFNCTICRQQLACEYSSK